MEPQASKVRQKVISKANKSCSEKVFLKDDNRTSGYSVHSAWPHGGTTERYPLRVFKKNKNKFFDKTIPKYILVLRAF